MVAALQYMTETQTLRKQIKKQLDSADNKALKMVKAILDIEQEADFWDELPDQVKQDIVLAKKESADEAGKSTEEVMKKYSKWLRQ